MFMFVMPWPPSFELEKVEISTLGVGIRAKEGDGGGGGEKPRPLPLPFDLPQLLDFLRLRELKQSCTLAR